MPPMSERNSGDRLQLPGYGLPLDDGISRWEGATVWEALPLTVRERAMLELIGALKDKPDWDKKVFDERIVAKWRTEAMAAALTQPINVGYDSDSDDNDAERTWSTKSRGLRFFGRQRQKTISTEMFDHCIEELRQNARDFQERNFTEALDANACVYMSDTLIPTTTIDKLKSGIAPLENVRDTAKDWHPGSNGQVLDLVHPSLFPLEYGRTRILPNGLVPLDCCSEYTGKGVLSTKPDSIGDDTYSRRFQWLPSEVTFDTNGQAKFTSYINNLHPDGNETLYEAIEEVITASLPLWCATLLSTENLGPLRITHNCGDDWVKKPDDQRPTRPHPTDPDEDADEATDDDSEDGSQTPEPFEDGYEDHYAICVPEPSQFSGRLRYEAAKEIDADTDAMSKAEKMEHVRAAMTAKADEFCAEARSKGLQVITKLANIHLRPDSPRYDGGSWHIEGLANEHIVASALYYYDSENITESHLAFRERVDVDAVQYYEQHHYAPTLEIFGIKDSDCAAVQFLGKVHTREGRLLAFPNVLQHSVSPFELKDESKPGHRKLLALFLVDPDIRIISTANVPPQRVDWWAQELQKADATMQGLPNEIWSNIFAKVDDFPISLEEAKESRQAIMEERGFSQEAMHSEFSSTSYNFCEH